MMEKIIDVAAYVLKKYHDVTKEHLDEMKLHKLLYFIQRESFAITGHKAFDGDFEGWKYGPVCKEVRNYFFNNEILIATNDISDELKYIANNVILEYGSYASWKLSELSHAETSWINSRKGLSKDENGNVKLSLGDIQEDSKKIRPYDHVWDMYYDEFEEV